MKDTDRAVRLAAIRERWKYASGYADLRPGTPVADLTWLLGEVARLEQDRDEWQAATARAARVKAEAALTEARRVLRWQPITTAPMNGTTVLLTDGHYIRTGYFAVRRNAWSVDTTVTLAMPTHWLSLPTAPPALAAVLAQEETR